MRNQDKAENVDVLVVGAGISGLYAAWRLMNERPELRIRVLEMMPRTGGRLESDVVEMSGVDGKCSRVKDEMGGMRFNPSMVELYRLFKAMDFTFDNGKIVPFEMADPSNRYYMRGRSLSASEMDASGNAIWSELFQLSVPEQGKSPGTLVREVMNYVLRLPENADLLHRELARIEKHSAGKHSAEKDSAEEDSAEAASVENYPTEPEQWSVFRNQFTYKGHCINAWGLWPLLMDYGMSNEAIKLVTSAIGFSGPVDQNINAGEQLQILCDFPNNPTYFTLNAGFESLPRTIEARLEAAQPGCVQVNQRVSQLAHGPNGYPQLTVIAGNGENYQIDCQHLILALPKYPLERLLSQSPNFDMADYIQGDLAGLQNMRLGKVNFYYPSRWWRDGGGGPLHGGSFTDLPAGSAYVFDPLYPDIESKYYQNASKKKKRKILKRYSRGYSGPSALTLYCDFINTNFWTQLQAIGGPYSTGFPQPPHSTAASTELVLEAQRQFKLIYARNDVPLPTLTTFRVWSDNDYGYGYHQWKLGRDDAVIRERLWRMNEHTYLCNEAYSDMQGWVNGSLRSTELMLQKAFDVPPLVSESERPGVQMEMHDYLAEVLGR
ncbi:MAG: flavin monoamine oxidase family protein [Congregibacter sp.]